MSIIYSECPIKPGVIFDDGFGWELNKFSEKDFDTTSLKMFGQDGVNPLSATTFVHNCFKVMDADDRERFLRESKEMERGLDALNGNLSSFLRIQPMFLLGHANIHKMLMAADCVGGITGDELEAILGGRKYKGRRK